MCAGDRVSHQQSLRTECTYSRTTRSCVRSVLRATRSQCGVPQLTLRAYPDDRLEDRGGTRPRFVERSYPTKAIITIPITLYGYGNGDDAEEGGPERRRDEREHGEYKRDKERCRCEARSAYDLFPNVFRCSCRTPHPALSRRVGIHPHTSSSKRSPGPRRAPMPYSYETFSRW